MDSIDRGAPYPRLLERFGERATSLSDWSALYARVTLPPPPSWGLRFVLYRHYSDAERQDPTTSHGWLLASARSLTAGHGTIARDVGDPGVSRELM